MMVFFRKFCWVFRRMHCTILNVINVDFAKNHNQLIKHATFDKNVGMKNAILGVINYTTREQYKKWRYQV